jgi:hypothetical protein
MCITGIAFGGTPALAEGGAQHRRSDRIKPGDDELKTFGSK